jgi:DNA polymerase, archaea type
MDSDAVLFGADSTTGIVAAALVGRFVRLFVRTDHGVVFHDDPFHPVMLLESADQLGGFDRPVSYRHLAGPGAYAVLATFQGWGDCVAARDFLAKRSGKTPSVPDAPYLFISDPIHQHLLLTGKTLFKGLDFRRLRRLALDIETLCSPGYRFSNPQRQGDRIITIAIMDSEGFQEVISGHELSEAAMLERLGEIIRSRDPDVVEGHNIFRFDLDYLRVRAERHGVTLRWGRDGSAPTFHPSRFTIAERTMDYPCCDIFGRHIIDTYFLVQLHDVSSREMESYGLKAAARHFGVAAADRTYLAGDAISQAWHEDPEALYRYNLDDVRETLALSRLLAPPYFLQTQIFPYSYQNCMVRGNATRINALFVREYLRRGAAIPRAPGDLGTIEGGYTDVLVHGVVGPVVHCDVASLYPSLLLAHGLKPVGDALGLFLPLLGRLRQFRLTAKKRSREDADPAQRERYGLLQQTFKVLINSFYGYLGSPLHNFADLAIAGRVTHLGRETIRTMIAWLQERHARVVEVDTDGIYFLPPAGFATPEQEEALVKELSGTLPEGIDVELDGRYKRMFSYKSKNYALLSHDDSIIVKGSALKSRGMEKYLREFMAELITLLLHDQGQAVLRVYERYGQRLRSHDFTIDWLSKTDTLREAPATYQQKVRQGKRKPSAAYEIALRSADVYRSGDQISYYISGRGKGVASHEHCRPVIDYDPAHPDVNVDFYLDKLLQVKKRFTDFLDDDCPLFSWNR